MRETQSLCTGCPETASLRHASTLSFSVENHSGSSRLWDLGAESQSRLSAGNDAQDVGSLIELSVTPGGEQATQFHVYRSSGYVCPLSSPIH